MPRDGTITRDKLLDAAQALVLKHGFSATSVDKVIEAAGVTKGSFFYHFPTKDALALALVERWAAADMTTLESNLARATELSRDPVQRILIFVGLLVEQLDDFGLDDPGCLYATYCYEAQLFGDEIHKVIKDAIATWDTRLLPLYEDAARAAGLPADFDPRPVVTLLTTVVEGAFVLTRTQGDRGLMAGQLREYRRYLELLFAPAK